MHRRPSFVRIVVVTLTLVGLAGALGATALAQQMPRALTLATNPPGTVAYTLAVAFAKVVSDARVSQMSVQPYAGTSTLLPALNTGELDFVLINGLDIRLAYQGPQRLKVGGKNPFFHTPNARLLMRGAPLIVGMVVRKDSPIKSVHDLKGRRAAGEFPAHLAVWYSMYAHLASAGLTWNDVKVVAVPTVNEGLEAVVQGRADASTYAINAAKVKEADAAVGIRHVGPDCSPEGEKRLRQAVPGYYTRVVKGGTATGIVEDTCLTAYDFYLVTNKALADHVVATVLKTIWKDVEKLPAFHPMFKEWTRERAVSPDATIPYHPGAIAFYREQGVWTAEMDQVQQRLLTLNP